MKGLLLSIVLLLTGGSAIAANTASYMRCNGTDTTGQSMYLIVYPNSTDVNINGDVLSIAGPTRNGAGVVTQNFISVYGVLVYDSIIPVNYNTLTIYQFNAVTQAILAQAWLTCNVYGGAMSAPGSSTSSTAAPNLMDQQIFNSIKVGAIKSTGGMPYNK